MSSTIEFEPVYKNNHQPTNVSKSTKTVRELKDGYTKMRTS